ncbi:protein MpNRPD1 [Marchantia polymorpha subsp. ruderalis]|uniref:DNA-directed RNA polymerase subunit n=2 Tax=Marchantia polymorpha TaxID=3197 RepID=A0AAF6AXS7_MARPO|nr:hypothetical protein MARPO_0006s0043 [Marchantia polymorpha]BBN04561.1 hypothetical protein Mp_3g05720 [Marchantia polymorpha subsp. ruderalis]|eukprot:PTQ47998.1 hypothetical protein MARPO_0006s0043 [Marchantia polymorpha]
MKKVERWKISGIEFDVLRSHDILKLSVVENDSIAGLIERPKDLYDARLGIPNESRRCETCQGTRRGVCDAKLSCDGHFGHIELPSAIYHPYHVRRVVKCLSKICLGCSRAFKKKIRPNPIQLDDVPDAVESQESATGKRVTRKRKFSETESEKKVPKSRKRNGIQKWLDRLDCDNDVAGVKEEDGHDVYTTKYRSWSSSVPKSTSPPLVQVKDEPMDFRIDDSYPVPPTQEKNVKDAAGRSSTKDRAHTRVTGRFHGSAQRGAKEVRREPRGEPEAYPGHSREDGSETASENSCRYCGKSSEGLGPKFPKVVLRVVTIVTRSGRVDAIQMIAEVKHRGAQIPSGFWDFVGGHPGAETENSRVLLPFEALKILRKVPVEDHARLDMDRVVTHPEAFIPFVIPVTPNCNRLIMDDWSSTLMPRIILGRGGPNSKLEALVSKVRQINSTKSSGKRTFTTERRDVEELQLLVARHLRACKVTDFSSFGKQKTTEQETGGSLELKWLKNHVLSKRSNFSARTIVNGDPNISICEIGIPYEMALSLTVQETVNSVNLRNWQKVIADIKTGRLVSPPGPLFLRTRNNLFDLREKCSSILSNYEVRAGDVFTRCLQNGDYLFANRPPSLHKHSLIALKVKLHHPLTFAINPLICAPFDADFDGDAFHVFVPQAVESIAELSELMSVSSQLVSTQGGQVLISLTQDTLVGGHFLTRYHNFFNHAEFCQLSMSCSVVMPLPAIVKSPAGPLWTGKQLYSMTLPRGFDFGTLRGDIYVKSGELLICKGSSGWLQTSVKGIVKAICDHPGPKAALKYLNSVQAMLHQWLMSRGFSVGLKDFYLAKTRESRRTMLEGIRRCLQRSEEASLRQVLKLDPTVQARILCPKPDPLQALEDVKHGGCFGLLLGENRKSLKIKDLQRSAIEKFQSTVPIIDNLIYAYIDSDNSLLAMVKSGSKGSMSRLVHQTACLGLQLYKGENLISVNKPNNKLFYYNQSLKFRREDVFDNKNEIICQPGYWESKGIITSSFLDGLNPAEFYLHTWSARGGMLREGIEEPNKIMRNLFLFMRDLYVAYDGSVRDTTAKRIIQFQYGGLKKNSKETHSEAAQMAGEPVGALAATAIAEPSYSVKLDSYHSSQLLKAGPIQLLQETLFPRRESTLTMRDRSVILRMFPEFGVQRRALRLKRGVERVPLKKFVSTLALEFSNHGGTYEKVYYDERKKASNECVKRSSPWQCRVLLNKKALRDYDLDATAVKVRLYHKFNSATSADGLPSIIFVDTIGYNSRFLPEIMDECLVFFFHECGEVPPPTGQTSNPIRLGEKNVSNRTLEGEKDKTRKISSEMITNFLIPELLSTTVKGHDEIEEVKVIWEDRDAGCRVARPCHYPPFPMNGNPDQGELVLEVHTRKPKGAGRRGSAYSIVKEAFTLFMDDIDWARSTPYSVQEIKQAFGVEAAHLSMFRRLRSATKDMGKPVREEHLFLVADALTHSGEVAGLSLAGYRDHCVQLSMSTPFTQASFQEPKKNFFQMAVRGARDNLGGALASAVWGRQIPLGSGADFKVVPNPEEERKCTTQNGVKSGSKLLAGLKGYLSSSIANRESGKITPRKQHGVMRSSVDGKLHKRKKDLDTIVKNIDIQMLDKNLMERLRLLLKSCNVGDTVDAESQKMLLQDVLIHHPRREEKFGCGVISVKVDNHPEYPSTKCFHVIRTDGSTSDFSYRKCLEAKWQNSSTQHPPT